MKARTTNAATLRKSGKIVLVIGVIIIAVAIRIVHDRTNSRLSPTPTELESAAGNNPNSLDAQLNWGVELRREGKIEDAKAVFTTAEALAPMDARATVWLGMIAIQQGRTVDAIADFKQALDREPKDPDVWLSLADLQQATGSLKDAEASFETVTRLQPGNEQAWRLLGELEVRRKQLSRGKEALETAVRLAPKDLKAQGALGELDLRLGRLPEAKTALVSAATQDPPNAVVLAQLAQAEMKLDASPGSLQAALKLISKSLMIKSTSDGLLARGQIHLIRKEYLAAIADLNAAIKLDKQALTAYGYLSQAYAAIGDARNAKMASEQYTVKDKSANSNPGGVSR